jgi:ATP/maltotriose-dependent transcriptional regulator MalT
VADLRGKDHELALQLEAFITNTRWLDSSLADAQSSRGPLPPVRAGDTLGERMILVALAGQAMFSGNQPASGAIELIRQALEDRRFVGEWGSEALQFWQAMYLLHAADELDLAERMERQALELARKRGSLAGLCVAAVYHAHLRLKRGRLREAEGELDYADQFGYEPWPQGLALTIHIRVEVLLEQGRLTEADRQAAALDSLHAPQTSLTHLFPLCSRGRLRVAQGRFDEALEDLLRVGRDSSTQSPAMFGWRSHAAPALAAVGRLDEARELLAQELELARRVGVPRPIGVNLRAAGVLAGGEPGIELLRESVQIIERCPSDLEHAHSLIELGSMLRRRGHRAESLPPLRHGLDLADQAGALALAQRARRELADAGARPHRPAQFGRDALTPSELRVAQMAAEGSSNKQIAQGLFVSLRTVETHLTHTYGKLGVSARRDLARALIESSARLGLRA